MPVSLDRPLRLAILQRVLPRYRIHLFEKLSALFDVDVKIYIGLDLPFSKVKSTGIPSSLNVQKLSTRYIRIGKILLVYHAGLFKALECFAPDVILCEGESNLLSYLQAALYRLRFPSTALVHWSLGRLPSSSFNNPFRDLLKKILLGIFDSYVVYSSFGRDELLRLGCLPDQIFVAVNVSDVDSHVRLSASTTLNPFDARRQLSLPDLFTIVYSGTFDFDKRLDCLIRAVAEPFPLACNLVLLGNGPALSYLQQLSHVTSLDKVFFPGSVTWELIAQYYRASNVFVLPGLGGMVISEAMAHGLPVIAYQADGTELDLIQNLYNGFLLESGSPRALRKALEILIAYPDLASLMGARSRDLISSKYSGDAAAKIIIDSIITAWRQRALCM
jgi:glycosyltransferase involved in cell wall biosynthesis